MPTLSPEPLSRRAAAMIIPLIKWTARVTGILFFVFFLVFFVGEGISSDFGALTVPELAMLLCIPCLFTAGVITTFRAEIAGSVLMAASVLGFNMIDMLASETWSLQCEFWYLLIPALLFVFYALKTGKRDIK